MAQQHKITAQVTDQPPIDIFLEFPVIWLSPGARDNLIAVRRALNRHWIVTQWDGSGLVDLQDSASHFSNPVFRYYGREWGESDVEIYAWGLGVHFVSLVSEIDRKDEPAVRLERITFTHDTALNLWFARGADILKVFPQLEPAWHSKRD